SFPNLRLVLSARFMTFLTAIPALRPSYESSCRAASILAKDLGLRPPHNVDQTCQVMHGGLLPVGAGCLSPHPSLTDLQRELLIMADRRSRLDLAAYGLLVAGLVVALSVLSHDPADR